MKKLLSILLLLVAFLISGCSSSLTGSCSGLGKTGTNASMGPGDPNKDTKCCGGLVMRSPTKCSYEASLPGGCSRMEGCASVCIACGNGKCDSKHENKCNCPEDCK